MYRVIRWSSLLLLLALVGCSRASQVVTVSEEDAGRTIDLRESDTLEVRLQGNPSTGFTWEVSPEGITILRQEGEPEFETDSSLVGAPTTIVVRFTTTDIGQETLRLVYHRPWEEDVAPENTFEIDVAVK